MMSPAPAPSAAATAAVAAAVAPGSAPSLLPAMATATPAPATPTSFENMLAGSTSGKAPAPVKDHGANAGGKGKDEKKDSMDDARQTTSLAGALLATLPPTPPPPLTPSLKTETQPEGDAKEASEAKAGKASEADPASALATTLSAAAATQPFTSYTTPADSPAVLPVEAAKNGKGTQTSALPTASAVAPAPVSRPPLPVTPSVTQPMPADSPSVTSSQAQVQRPVRTPMPIFAASSTAHRAVATAMPAGAEGKVPTPQNNSTPASSSTFTAPAPSLDLPVSAPPEAKAQPDPVASVDPTAQPVDPTAQAPASPASQPAEPAQSTATTPSPLSTALQSGFTQPAAAINTPANSAASTIPVTSARAAKSEKIAPATVAKRSEAAVSEKIQSPAKADESLLGGVIAQVRKAAGTTVAKGASDMVSTVSNSSFSHAGHAPSSEADSLPGALAQAGDEGDQSSDSSDSSDSQREPEFVVTTARADRSTDAASFVAPTFQTGSDFTTASAVVKSNAPSALSATTLQELQAAVEHVRSQGDSTVQMKVSLEGAGQVEIQLSLRAGGIHATVATSSPELQEALRQHWAQIQGNHNGSDQSFRVADLKFTSTGGSGFSNSFDSSRQQSSRQQPQDFAAGDGAYPSDSAATNRTNPPARAARATSGGLNLWA
ncbi:MAG: hypothetical protein QM796_19840 [Chthoniobacteraceae bacterium]